jgi:EmrB/QacA subfamily drug resistance transporter
MQAPTISAIERWAQRPWPLFVLVATSILMYAIDSTVVAVALPTLVADLDTTLVLAAWTITGYALAQTVMQPMGGKLAEQFGQMRVFVACVFLFTLGSLLCYFAPNIYFLIGCRLLQAIGGGGAFPSATGLIAQQFPRTRNRMVGLFASIFPIGGILGPNVGGFVIAQFGWREAFLINVPLGIILLALLGRAALAPSGRRAGERHIDLVGAALFTTSIVSFMVGLTWLGQQPSLISSALFWGLMLTCVGSLGLFVWQQQRARDPILDLTLVVNQPFLAVNVFGLLTGVCFMGFFSFIPYYATVQFHMGPMESGAILTPRSLVMIVVSTTTSFMLQQIGYRMPMLVGMACVTGALLLLGVEFDTLHIGGWTIDPIVPLLAIMSLSGLGMGLLIPASNNAGLDLEPRRAAMISGLRGLFNSTGGVVGTAIIVLWLALSPDQAEGMRVVFLALGIIMIVSLPLVFMIPDRATERRRAAKLAATEEERAAARRAVSGTAAP